VNDGDGGVEKELGFGLIALLPIACCVGLPLIVATGISVAAVAWAGGIALGVAAFAARLFCSRPALAHDGGMARSQARREGRSDEKRRLLRAR
jgi:hypothetical protein